MLLIGGMAGDREEDIDTDSNHSNLYGWREIFIR